MLVGAIAVSLAAINAQAGPQAGLIHRYSFNNDVSTAVDSVGGAAYAGTLFNYTNGVANGAAGQGIYDNVSGNLIGYGYNLYNLGNDGTNFVSSVTSNSYYAILPTNLLAGLTNATIETWFLAGDSQHGSGNQGRIYDMGDPNYSSGSGRNFIDFVPQTSATPSLAQTEFNLNGTLYQFGAHPTLSGSSTASGYHHAAVVYDASATAIDLYIDGALESHNATSLNLTTVSNGCFWLGRSEWSGDYFFYGYIDEFRIYNTALSGVEIAASYNIANNTTNLGYNTVSATLGSLVALHVGSDATILENTSLTNLPTADFTNSTTTTYYPGLSVRNYSGFTLTSSSTNATVNGSDVVFGVHPGTVTITGQYAGVTSSYVVTITPDTTPATVTKAVSLGYSSLLQLTFNKAVDPATATNVANYVFSTNNLVATNATIDASGFVVTLRTTTFDVNGSYTVTINNVKDTVTHPNTTTGLVVPFGAVVGSPLTRIKYYQTLGNGIGITGTVQTNTGYPWYATGSTNSSLTNGLSNTNTTDVFGDNYAEVVNGFLVPDETGTFNFYLACDDDAAIYISTDSTTNNLPTDPTLQIIGWANADVWSGPVSGGNSVTGRSGTGTNYMVAGNKYFFRVLHYQGSGGDNLEVGWTTPNEPTTTNSIGPSYLIPSYSPTKPVTITTQPQDILLLNQNFDATFSFSADSFPVYTGIQWYRVNAAGVTNAINGANGFSFTQMLVTNTDNSNYYFAVISNLVDTVSTRSALLTVTNDPSLPNLLWGQARNAASAVANGVNDTNITLAFSKRMNSNSITAANFLVSNTVTKALVTVKSATRDANYTNAYLTLGAPLSDGVQYAVIAKSGVKDLSGNAINSTNNTVFLHGAILSSPGRFVVYGYTNYTSDTAATQILTDYKTLTPFIVVSYPNMEFGDTAESFWGDNRATVEQGWITAPETGNYVFHISSDDASRMFLSTDSTPGNTNLICGLDGWTSGIHNWDTKGTYSGTNSSVHMSSDPISLVAGQSYYYIIGFHQGGGGAYVSVAWTLPISGGTNVISGAYLTSPALADLSTLSIATNPVSVTVNEGYAVTFTGVATGTISGASSTPSYQWYIISNGVTSVIPLANSASYSISPWTVASQNNNQYFFVASEPGLTATSTVAKLTVNASTAVSAVSAGVLTNGNIIGIKFNNWLNLSASNIANYSVSSGTITNVLYRSNIPSATVYGNIIALQVQDPITGPVTVTYTGISDLFGHTASGSVPVSIVPDLVKTNVGFHNDGNGFWADGLDFVTPAATNNPSFDGIVIPTSANSFEITAAGDDIWDSFDRDTFLNVTPQWANFDARVRVISERYASDWTKVGIDVRESLYSGARHLDTVVQPTTGYNEYETCKRVTASPTSSLAAANAEANQDSANWYVTGYSPVGHASAINPPAYPNAWIRIVCSNNVYFSYTASVASPAASDWRLIGSNNLTANPYAASLVGIAATAHANSAYTTAEFADFSLTEFITSPGAPTLKAARNADGSITISWTGAGFTLKESSDLTSWSVSSLTPTSADGSNYSVIITSPSASKFYRLVWP